jgi:carbamoyl-phosphate synthase small subunit
MFGTDPRGERMMWVKALLVLSDGTTYEGLGIGARGLRFGELVTNTKMVGYDQVITDPACFGQLVAMTYPLIGNYGINLEDLESKTCHLAGLILDHDSRIFSNWRAKMDLNSFLEEQGVTVLTGIDTRSLTVKIRTSGTMPAAIAVGEYDTEQILSDLKAQDVYKHSALDVTCQQAYVFSDGAPHVAVLDLGVTTSQLSQMAELALKVTVLPASAGLAEIEKVNPNGLFLSSGPGDPNHLPDVIRNVTELLPRLPIFGVGLGHLVLGKSLGVRSTRLPVGHRGANYPVKNLITGKLAITEQNHGYVLDSEDLPKDVQISHINLVDETIEGIKSERYPAFGVQYRPTYTEGEVNPEFQDFYNMLCKTCRISSEGCESIAQKD